MVREKVCVMCGQPYYATVPNTKYCSLTCREAMLRRKRKQWEADHPGYNAEYARKRRQAAKVDQQSSL